MQQTKFYFSMSLFLQRGSTPHPPRWSYLTEHRVNGAEQLAATAVDGTGSPSSTGSLKDWQGLVSGVRGVSG